MRLFFTHGYCIMARRRKKTFTSFLSGLLGNLFLNSFLSLAALVVMWIWL